MTDNIILVDWLTFSIHGEQLPTVNAVIDMLGLTGVGFLARNGHYGYRSAVYFGGIWIMYDGRDDMGVCVEMSGQGCRQFETSSIISFAQLFDVLVSGSDRNLPIYYNITRLDVAYDDIDHDGSGLLDIVKICKFAYQGRYISKFAQAMPQVDCVVDQSGKVDRAHTCYFGSPKSDVRIRFYDKAQERGGLGYHWVRCELQLRDERAYNFLTCKDTWGNRFFGVLNNYLRFVTPNKQDSNRRRWASPKWWTDFLQSLDKISIYTAKGVDYNLTRLEHYIIEQCGNSIDTFIQCVGMLKFQQLLKHRDSYLNANQQALVIECQAARDKQLKDYWERNPWG